MPVATTSSGGQRYTAVTRTQTSPDIRNLGCVGVKVVLVTSAIGTGNITLRIQGKVPGAGTYYTILVGSAVSTNTTNVYTVALSITVTANVSVRDLLPEYWRFVVTANNSNAATYSVGFSMIP